MKCFNLKLKKNLFITADWLFSILYYVPISMINDLTRYRGLKRNVIFCYVFPIFPFWILLQHLEWHNSIDPLLAKRIKETLYITIIIFPFVIYSIKWLIFDRTRTIFDFEDQFTDRQSHIES